MVLSLCPSLLQQNHSGQGPAWVTPALQGGRLSYLSHARVGVSQLDHHGEVRGGDLEDTEEAVSGCRDGTLPTLRVSPGAPVCSVGGQWPRPSSCLDQTAWAPSRLQRRESVLR